MKPLSRTYLYASLGLLALDAAWHGGAAVPAAPLVARIHDSDFPLGHDTYNGMYDQFSYGYLGFALGPDGRTIHYLTGGPGPADATRTGGKPAVATGSPGAAENFHLITYDIPERAYRDHGRILLENGDRPAGVNSIAIGKDGTVYTLSRIDRSGATVTDLISIPGPFGRGGS